MRYWRTNLSLSLSDLRQRNILLTLVGYAMAVTAAFGGTLTFLNVQAVPAILVAMALGACLYFVFLVVIVTPKRMWDCDQKKLDPRLHVTFGEVAPFQQIAVNSATFEDGSTTSITDRLFRIEVQNLSDVETIDDVTVELDHVIVEDRHGEREALPFRPIPLHQMHDNPPDGQPYQQHFGLNPRQRKYIDVLRRVEVDRNPRAYMMLQFAVLGISGDILPETYRLDIIAHGRNVPPCQRSFRVSVDGQTNETLFHQLQ